MNILKHITILLIALLSYGCSDKLSVTEKPEPIRGVWLTNVASEALFSKENIKKAVQLCKESGINTIYTVTWNRGYTQYPSRLMKDNFGVSIDPRFEGRDPLQELIDAAHAEDIKVVAWFEFGFSHKYKEEGNSNFLNDRPSWIAINQSGEPVQKNGFYWMNALNPDVQQFMIDMIIEVVSNYDVDGIQGDDRLPAMPSTAGYDHYTTDLYKQEHMGKYPPENYKDEEWVQWRCNQLTKFIGKLYREVKRVNESVTVSMAPSIYPWSKYEYLQDWPTWVNEGYLDHIAPQVYRYTVEAYQKTLKENVLKYIAPNKREILTPGVLLNISGYEPSDSLIDRFIQINRENGLEGEVFFYYEGLKQHPKLFNRYRNSYEVTHDVIVIGGGASGTAAGVQSARTGASTLIIEEHEWLGGMLTSAGVSCVDGNHKLPSGLFGEFKDSLIARYGTAEALKTGWVSHTNFEPQVGDQIFQNMVSREPLVNATFNTTVKDIRKDKDIWIIKVDKDGEEIVYRSKVLIDATELGDVAAAIGVKYDIGMDSKTISGEDIAPDSCNNIIQDLTYVLTLKDFGKDMTIDKPYGYDPSLFYCSTKSDRCVNPKPNQAAWPKESMITYGKLPNGSYMINWPIDGNDYYTNTIEMDPKDREIEFAKAKNFSLCFLYYMQTELGFNSFGLADNIYPTEDNLPMIPYHRESRRISGEVRLDLNHISKPYNQKDKLYRTGIAVGDYPIDHHHYRYSEWSTLPKLHFYPVPSYSVPLGTLFPKGHDNLIVAEKSISVTNIVNGTTRLQPVVIQIGQAAGASAALIAIENRDFSVREVQKELLKHGGYILPYLDVKKDDPNFLTYQKVGATGLLRGVGMNVGWENQTWLHVDSILTGKEMAEGFKDFTGSSLDLEISDKVTIFEALNTISKIAQLERCDIAETSIYKDRDINSNITRGEYATLLDLMIDPFYIKDINYRGEFIK